MFIRNAYLRQRLPQTSCAPSPNTPIASAVPAKVSFTQAPEPRSPRRMPGDAERLLVALSGGQSDPGRGRRPVPLEQDYRTRAAPDAEWLLDAARRASASCQSAAGRRWESAKGCTWSWCANAPWRACPILAEVRDAVANEGAVRQGGGEPGILRSAARALRGHCPAPAVGRVSGMTEVAEGGGMGGSK